MQIVINKFNDEDICFLIFTRQIYPKNKYSWANMLFSFLFISL